MMAPGHAISGACTPSEGLHLLPDIPGKVHGIVQWDPFIRIQCDGCGYIHDGKPGKAAFAIMTSGILFSRSRYRSDGSGDQRRLCRECRKSEWDEPEPPAGSSGSKARPRRVVGVQLPEALR